MPTVNQVRLKLKRKLETKNIQKELTFMSNSIKHGIDQESSVSKCVVSMEVWDDPHPALKLTPEDKLKNVWIAGYPSTFEALLWEYKEPGDSYFPDGGYVLRIKDRRADRGTGSTMNLYYEEAILHPDELTEERLEPYFTIQDGRKA